MPMRRRSTPQQLDLFAHPSDAAADPASTPHWQTLPDEARVTLTRLMVRLILDHAVGLRTPQPTEARHEA
jgi:hypothetical protein